MTVRAKFKVTRLAQVEHWDKAKGHIHEVEMQPVTSGSKENEGFYAATPGGSIKLMTINDEAAKHFKLGAEIYIDFTPA
ncbi:hypothetical protein [Cupriavidus sp. IDO]|uniref:hypothetical protein n=1 Tax=Cupriavidus sp. IDO TaxID=1539142 RepID=UPI000579472A|nr:hypothetical protein [Cupriavidus sp. IDO]KWR88782.1 hypothetical protein RM96_17870 [Cupriavidus sp. IDO]